MLSLVLLTLLATDPSPDDIGANAALACPTSFQLASPTSGQVDDVPSLVSGLALSADGRVLAVATDAGDLVDGADGPSTDVFRHDLVSGEMRLLSRRLDGGPALRPSQHPAISADGRVVAFTSWAAGLTDDDGGRFGDVFVAAGPELALTRISSRPDGSSARGTSERPSISAYGRWVVFQTWADDLVPGDENGRSDIALHDRQTGTTRLISRTAEGHTGAGDSTHPVISADGSVVAFLTRARDLVPGAGPGVHIVLHDVASGATRAIDRAPDGAPPNHDPGPVPGLSLSSDGRVVAFVSRATNLVPGLGGIPRPRVHVRDLTSGRTARVDQLVGLHAVPGEASYSPSLSADGRTVAFSTIIDPPFEEVLIHGLDSGLTQRFGVSEPRADVMLPSLAADASRVAVVADGHLPDEGEHPGHDAVVIEL